MSKENKEVAILNFLLQKEVVYTVIIIIILFLLYPIAKQVVGRARLSFVYSKIKNITEKQLDFYTSNTRYAYNFANLNMSYTDNYDNPFNGDEVETGNFSLRLGRKGIFAINQKEKYFVYYDYEQSTLYCAPKDSYICRNLTLMPKNFCLEAKMLWSDKTNACYMNAKDLCIDSGMPWNEKINNGFCGYKDTNAMEIYQTGTCLGTIPSGCQNSIVYKNASCEGLAPYACIGSELKGGNCVVRYDNACHSVKINDGSFCIANTDFYGAMGCQNAIINKGGTCLATGSNVLGCNRSIVNEGGMCRGYAIQSCNNTVILAGGICEGNISTACQNISVKAGGKCISNTPKTCNGTYEIGSCCHGDFCPEMSPKCDCPNFAAKC